MEKFLEIRMAGELYWASQLLHGSCVLTTGAQCASELETGGIGAVPSSRPFVKVSLSISGL